MLHRCVRGLMCDATSATQHQRVFLNGTNIMYFSPPMIMKLSAGCDAIGHLVALDDCAEWSMCVGICLGYVWAMLELRPRVFCEAKALGLAFHNMLLNPTFFLNCPNSWDGASEPGRRSTPSSPSSAATVVHLQSHLR